MGAHYDRVAVNPLDARERLIRVVRSAGTRGRIASCAAISGLFIVTAAAASSADGIALNKRIGAVSLGESHARVTNELGMGSRVRLDHLVWFRYRRAALYVLYAPSRTRSVFEIQTRSRRYETSSGVHVGSSMRRLKRAVRVHCYPHNPIQCQHGYRDFGPGTTFLVSPRTHQVTEVVITYGH